MQCKAFQGFFPGCITEANTNFPENDIGEPTKLESRQACAEHCASIDGGLFWTFSHDTKNCYVKSSDSGRKTETGIVSGNLACGVVHPLDPLGVAVSQRNDEHPPHQCVNSNPFDFCVVDHAPFPWLAIHFGSKVRVDRVEIRNRRDCCPQKRLRNFEVRVTDSLPSSGALGHNN